MGFDYSERADFFFFCFELLRILSFQANSVLFQCYSASLELIIFLLFARNSRSKQERKIGVLLLAIWQWQAAVN